MRLIELIGKDEKGNTMPICILSSSIVKLYSDTIDSPFCIVEYLLPNKRRKTGYFFVAEPYKTIVTRLGVQTAPDAMSIFELGSHE